MAKAKATSNRKLNENPPKKTSQGRGLVKTSSMNKHKKRSHKRYRGQG
jgi:hypothetical protein